MRFLSLTAIALLCAGLPAAAAAAGPAGFPTLAQQFIDARVVPGSALEALIRANQDLAMLRPEEAKDRIGLPPWLRVWWRKAHPEGSYRASDPTGGYPLVLHEIHEWMLSHQSLVPGPGSAPDAGASERATAAATSTSGEERISGAQTTPRSESDIRVNPWDPTKVIAASNNISGSGQQAQLFSTDSGATWGQTYLSLQPGDSFHSDPTVEWTSDGTAWSMTIGLNSNASVLQMRAYKSADHGATWTFDATFSGSQTATDKEMLWADHGASSPYKDNLYTIWHNGNPVFMNRRTGPSGAWQTPIQVSGAETTGTGIGGDVKTNAQGDVFGFWPDTGSRGIFVVKSSDGGASYGTPVRIATTYDSFDIGVPSFASRRALIYVTAGAWRTATQNLVYATWTDLTGASGCTSSANEPGTNTASTCKTRIWFTRSTDGGATWESARMLNDPASLNDQFNPWMTVDEATGALAVMYYDTVADSGRKKVQVYYQSSFDRGQSWSAAFQVTSVPTDETSAGADSGNQFGDYNSLSGYQGVFFPSWTDRRANLSTSHEEIWTARIDDPACTPPGAPVIGSATTPAANQVQVSWSNGTPAAASFDVERALGTCAAPGPFSAIATGVAGSPYLDSGVSGASTYAYRVLGRDATGRCKSDLSACVEATATGACTLAPSFAGLASATNGATSACSVALAWPAATPSCAGPVSYNVYRGAPGFTPATANRIATGVSGTTYGDAGGLIGGATYEYVVRAVDTSNAAEESNGVRRSASPTGAISYSTWSETFEGAGGFDLPGWSHAALSGPTDWVVTTARSQSPTHSWFSQDTGTTSDRVLVSPAFWARSTPATTVDFFHTYAFEGNASTCYDAGTLEYSADGGAWLALDGAHFSAGGYNGTANPSFGNPIAGSPAWCGGTIGALTEVTADLGFLAGRSVRLRWHEGDDPNTVVAGWYVDSVTLGNAGAAASCEPSGPGGLGFYALPPCRVVDTRNPSGPLGGPALGAGTTRGFALAGACGIPPDARAVSLNLTVASPTASGFLTQFPAIFAGPPIASILNFKPGATRANNAVAMLGPDGTNDLKLFNGSAGTVDVVIDVNGYFK